MGPLATHAPFLAASARAFVELARFALVIDQLPDPHSAVFGMVRDQIGPAINDLFTWSEHPLRAEPNPKLGAHDNSMAPDPQPEPSRFWDVGRIERDDFGVMERENFPTSGSFKRPRDCCRIAHVWKLSPFHSALATSALRWPSSSGSEFPSLAVTTCLPKTGILHGCPRSIHSVLTDVLDGSGRRIPGAILLFGDGSKKSGSTVPKGRSHVRPPRHPPGAMAAKGTHRKREMAVRERPCCRCCARELRREGGRSGTALRGPNGFR